MLLIRDRRSLLRKDRLDSHDPHEPLDSLMVYLIAQSSGPHGHVRRSVKRRFRILFVDQLHGQVIQRRDRSGTIIVTRPGKKADKFALADKRNHGLYPEVEIRSLEEYERPVGAAWNR